MTMTKINFDQLEPFLSPTQVLFLRPYKCKVVRVYKVSRTFFEADKYRAIIKKLNDTCSFKKGVTWFYLPAHIEKLHEALFAMYNDLEVQAILCEQEAPEFGCDANNLPDPSILN